ncbi:43100_t:CDS:2 [Gigaspora margarita]|uniref:43100_t:CDS:1 n=1 Tax=Gigaspora margarita TaxID=4874 RepID=A0ABN7VFJ7_GIGMA|nr:43100_t:CDS:2 [Gigaspora margarita]
MIPITVDPETTTKPELSLKLEELTSYVKDNIPDIAAQNGESLTTNPTMSDHHTTHNHPLADRATNSDPYYAHMDDTDSNNYCTPILPVPTNFPFFT